MSEQAIISSAAAGGGASKVTTAGASVGIVGWLASSEVVAIVGLAVALAGFVLNWYYKREALKLERAARAKAEERAEALHRLREEYIRRGMRTDTDLAELGLDE